MKPFSATLTIEQQHIQQCAYAILHLISFDRLLGTVKPAYVSVLGLQVPAISDPQLDAILLSRAAELASLVKGSEGSRKVELKVEFSIPTHPKTRTSGGGGEHKGAGEAGGGGVGGNGNQRSILDKSLGNSVVSLSLFWGCWTTRTPIHLLSYTHS
ncbi:hypothetical protein NDA13_004822 [Ustilago tritici]|nr:hypothetical protein NDA13_004822 [Ustilago tritici]